MGKEYCIILRKTEEPFVKKSIKLKMYAKEDKLNENN